MISDSLAVENISKFNTEKKPNYNALMSTKKECSNPTIVMNYTIDNKSQKAFTVQLKQCFSYDESAKILQLASGPEHRLVSIEPSFQQYINIPSGCENFASKTTDKAIGANGSVISRCRLQFTRIGGGIGNIVIGPAPGQATSFTDVAKVEIGSTLNKTHPASFTMKFFGNASNRVEFSQG